MIVETKHRKTDSLWLLQKMFFFLTPVAMIKEKENLLFRKRHFCLGSFQLIDLDWEKHFFPVQLAAEYFHVRDVISIKQ